MRELLEPGLLQDVRHGCGSNVMRLRLTMTMDTYPFRVDGDAIGGRRTLSGSSSTTIRGSRASATVKSPCETGIATHNDVRHRP